MPNGLTDHQALPCAEGVLADVGDGAVRRRAEVDRRRPAAGGGRPARAQELLAGRDQVVRPAARALGVEHQDVGVVGHQVDEQLHLVDEHRRERLHALDGDAGRDLVGQLEQLRVLAAELGGPLADLVGEQQLAARRRPEPLDLLEGALVGDRERADLLDVVAPELHPQRVLLGRREDVDDAAADRELAALLDQVDAGVRRGREPAYDVLERSACRPATSSTGSRSAEPLDLRLEHRADRRDDHLERAVGRVGARVPEPAQHGEPAADRVAARAQPLVRQRLPARVVADQRRVDQVAQRRDQVLGLAGGRGHRQHRCGPRGPARRRRTAASPRARSGPGSARRRRGRPPSPGASVGSARTASARPERCTGASRKSGTDNTTAPGQRVTGGDAPSLRRHRRQHRPGDRLDA